MSVVKLSKKRLCMTCGREFIVRKWSKAKLCRDCRMRIQKELVSQLKDKVGRYYYRWFDGVKRFVDKSTKVGD